MFLDVERISTPGLRRALSHDVSEGQTAVGVPPRTNDGGRF